jgi:hypothetical protein
MTTAQRRVRIKREDVSLTADDIVEVARRESPRRLNAYFVEVEGKRFPPKQLLRAALPGAPSFDTGVAVRALQSLGFEVVRLDQPK